MRAVEYNAWVEDGETYYFQFLLGVQFKRDQSFKASAVKACFLVMNGSAMLLIEEFNIAPIIASS